MKIHNLRLGPATNSSSSHSVIIVNDPSNITERYSGDFEFGWDNFTLTTPESKMHYFAVQLYYHLRNKVDKSHAAKLVNEWVGVDLTREMDDDGYGPSIDHQSVWSFPSNTNEQFFKEMAEWAKRDDVIFLGGNDNSNGHPLNDYEAQEKREEEGNELFIDKLGYGGGSNRLRKDGDYWTMFNHRSGDKVRFSFLKDAPEYTKATTPELVDLKITNYCPMGCAFCYQSSTPKGTHASLEDITDTVKRLAELGVMEIAIGGGEPTMHPDFPEILRVISENGIIPNFTTYSTKWIKNEKILTAVKEYALGIGVSIHNASDLETKLVPIQKAVGTGWNSKQHILAQHALGSVSSGETNQLILELIENHRGTPILFLGYKEVGFGANQPEEKNIDSVAELLKLSLKEQLWYANISVDTAVINKYPNLMEMLNPDPVLLTSQEGKFSMYIDAVENTMGPSSYVSDDEMIDLSLDIKAEFAKW